MLQQSTVQGDTVDAGAAVAPEKVLKLRYFNCRGRANALRLMLADSGMTFENVLVPLPLKGAQDWREAKGDPNISGPFGSLPTLAIPGVPRDVVLNETLAIGAYLSRIIARAKGQKIDEIQWAMSLALASHCYLDMIAKLMDTFWSPARMAGISISRHVTSLKSDLIYAWERIEKTYFSVGELYVCGGDFPTVGDYFLAEALDLFVYLLGEEESCIPEALLRFRRNMFAREGIAAFVGTTIRFDRVSESETEGELQTMFVSEWKAAPRLPEL